MLTNRDLLGATALLTTCAVPAIAQDAPPATGNEIVVTGIRATLANSAQAKRNSDQIQDSILAEDLGRLPDTNIAETLQRIPGVQVARNTRGEGNAYVVKGLKQVMTTVNDRQIFSTTNRSALLLDFSADLLSGVDVFKTATSDQIEGGLGGLINIRTARAFDHDGFHLAATATASYSEFSDRAAPRLSAIVSDIVQVGSGELGLMVGGQYEDFYSAGYQTSTNAYADNTALFDVNGNGVRGQAADRVTIPGQVRARYETGERTRAALYSSVQWRPVPEFTLSLDGLYTHSNGRSATQQLTVQTDGQTRGGAVGAFKPGTAIPDTYSYVNPLLRSQTGATENPYDTYHGAISAEWESGPWLVSGQFAYTDSRGPFYSRSIVVNTRAAEAGIDLGGVAPDFTTSGVNLTDPAAYGAASYNDLATDASGKQPSARFDVKYEVDGGPITALLAGARWTDHRAIYDVYSVSRNVTLAQPFANVAEPTPDRLFRGGQRASTNQWLAINDIYLDDKRFTRQLANQPLEDPEFPLTGNYDYREKTLAGYVQAQFAFDAGTLPIDGNLGLRAVRTDGVQRVYQRNAAGVLEQIAGGSPYTNWLPSVNVRASFTPDLFLRLAYSKAMTRPEFGQLSPALVLSVPNLTGSGGNPDLRATEADQYDLSLEYYFNDADYIAVSLFQKDVNGFIQEFRDEETIDGQVFLINRPRNANDGRIRGVEASYQQFFDFLPGILSGLGVRGAYTFVDSALEVQGQANRVPADQLSRHSFNVTGIYDRGPLSLYASYNWRSRAVQSNSADAAGRTFWIAPREALDFSASYALTERVTLKFDMVNILKSYIDQYYDNPGIPALSNQLDRSYQFGVRFSL
ncbi:TonB-dependent receptor (plasmid) [Croceibacterium sp. TMG7-5b_MA50]|uniref:TonB-dependent receptor n=1 Tax=Croceibacterium sp. TMG7-5b_MA50 TaxID=3121290 RepID=UPI003221E72B